MKRSMNKSGWQVARNMLTGLWLVLTFFYGSNSYGAVDYEQFILAEYPELQKIVAESESRLQAEPDDPDTLKTLGIAHHYLSLLGKKGESDKAVFYLEKVMERHPQDYEALAFLGSSYTLAGRDAQNPFSKIANVNKGCKMLDQAVANASDNIAVRMTRGVNSLGLPSMFRRTAIAKTDLSYLIDLQPKRARDFTPALLANIHFNLGEYYKDRNDWPKARECWQKAVTSAPDSKSAREAQKRLATYKID